MKEKTRVISWLCLTVMVTAGLKYVPPYLLEQRKLDQQERVLDIKESMYLKQHGVPTVSLPTTARHYSHSQLL